MTVAITTEGDTEIEYDAFDGHNEKFLLICDEKTPPRRLSPLIMRCRL